jgi:hypothetical protein
MERQFFLVYIYLERLTVPFLNVSGLTDLPPVYLEHIRNTMQNPKRGRSLLELFWAINMLKMQAIGVKRKA